MVHAVKLQVAAAQKKYLHVEADSPLQAIVGSIARARTPGISAILHVPLHDSSLGHALAAGSLRTITTKEGASSPPAPPPQQTYQLQFVILASYHVW